MVKRTKKIVDGLVVDSEENPDGAESKNIVIFGLKVSPLLLISAAAVSGIFGGVKGIILLSVIAIIGYLVSKNAAAAPTGVIYYGTTIPLANLFIQLLGITARCSKNKGYERSTPNAKKLLRIGGKSIT